MIKQLTVTQLVENTRVDLICWLIIECDQNI
jgi:hypothetical protein